MAMALVLRAHGIDVVFSGIVYHAPGRLSSRETIEVLLLINVIYEPEEIRNALSLFSGCPDFVSRLNHSEKQAQPEMAAIAQCQRATHRLLKFQFKSVSEPLPSAALA